MEAPIWLSILYLQENFVTVSVLLYLYLNWSLVQGPTVQENCWSEKKVSGPPQDKFVDYTITNTKIL